MTPPTDAVTRALRRDAETLFRRALAAAHPGRGVRQALASAGEERGSGGHVGLLAFGKAAPAMATAAVSSLSSDVLCGGVVVVDRRDRDAAATTVDHVENDLAGLEVIAGEHPVPGEGSLAAAFAVERFLREAPCERFLVLVSGGASALLCAPAEGIDLAGKQETTDLLLHSGASIQEVNTVRRHLSRIKGGNLARRLAGRPALVLVLSDVPGDELSAIASGPLAADPTTFADALEVLRRRGLLESAPRSVVDRLEAGARGELEENPGPGDPLLEQIEHRIVGGSRFSIEAASDSARGLGYAVETASQPVTGEAREVGQRLTQRLTAPRAETVGGARRRAWIGGGETTVTVRGDGRGGRNQELALAFALAAPYPASSRRWCLLSAGTDGLDGPTDAAGALVDGGTLHRATAAGLHPEAELARNNSYAVLDAAGDLLRIGPTGTNVGDLHVLLVAASPS